AFAGDQDVVLDADAEVAVGEVDAGLDGDDHAGAKRAVGSDVVDFEAELVADAVDEGVGVPGFVDHVSGGCVHVGNSRAGASRLDRSELRPQHDVVSVALLGGETAADRERAGDVGGVAAVYRGR